MFKIQIPITQFHKAANGDFIIEGVASGPLIDVDYERFSESALMEMEDCVNKGGIPIRLEHEDKIYTDVGMWSSAKLNDKFELVVKGKLDTELSLGRDMAVMLKRGKPLQLSVGGNVHKVDYEFDEASQRDVKTYKSVSLNEISLVKYPAYVDTYVQIGKSINWQAIPVGKDIMIEKDSFISEEGRKVEEFCKGRKKVAAEVMQWEMIKEKANPKAKQSSGLVISKWADKVHAEIKEAIKKNYDEIDEESCYPDKEMTAEDLKMLAMLITIMNEVELPDMKAVEDIYMSEEYQALAMEGHQDRFVVLAEQWIDGEVETSNRYLHHNRDYSVNRDWLLMGLKMFLEFDHMYMSKENFICAMQHFIYHLKELELISAGKSTKPSNSIPLSTNINPMTKKEEIQKAEGAPSTPDVVEVPETTPAAEVAATPEVTPEVTEAEGAEATPEVAETVTTEVTPSEPEQVEVEAPEKSAKPVEVEAKFDKAAVETLTKSIATLNEVVTGLVEKASKYDELAKSVELQSKILKAQNELIDSLVQKTALRKSVANFQPVEKTVNADGATLSHGEVTKALLAKAKADGVEMTFEQAYAKATNVIELANQVA